MTLWSDEMGVAFAGDFPQSHSKPPLEKKRRVELRVFVHPMLNERGQFPRTTGKDFGGFSLPHLSFRAHVVVCLTTVNTAGKENLECRCHLFNKRYRPPREH